MYILHEKNDENSTYLFTVQDLILEKHRLHWRTKKKLFFFKTRSNFLHILEENDVLNMRLPSDFPLSIRLFRDFMLQYENLQTFRVTLFVTLAKKIHFISKTF